MFTTRLLAGIALSTVLAVGCTRDQPQSSVATRPPSTAAADPTPGVAARGPAADTASATILETMDSGGYTYAKIDRGGEQVWAAGPETKLAVGAQLGALDGTVMTDFRSNTLNRTFDRILFVSRWPVTGASPAPTPTTPSPTTPAPITPAEKIAPATGGKTIAQVFDGKAALTGKSVVVRGKVTKFNAGILGRNWIHLQDGTGTDGTNDLTFTTAPTAAAVAVGDVIVVRGTVAIDKDFGGGYSYPVIVEDAAITK